MSVSADELKHFLDRIKQLNPKPGHLFDQSDAFLPSPDLIITLGPDQGIRLRLNERNHPCLIYEPGAFHMLDAKAKAYVKAKESEAGWLIHSLQQRRENLLKMGQSLIQQQEDFFRHGIMALKPLTLKSVAEDTGLHESTISRLKSNKYALTPYGMMELKSFFSVAVKALSSFDDDISATCVKNEIRMCIQDEAEDKPFSDDQLVYELAKKGINISRRTVTKYREQLNLPSSYGRKRASKRRQFT